MGDFNDEPFDTSLVTHALSTRQRRKVLNADNPLFWNLAWPIMGGRPDQTDGTFYFNSQPNMLDQFLVNKNMAAEGSHLGALDGGQSSAIEVRRRQQMPHGLHAVVLTIGRRGRLGVERAAADAR
jgi:hypothetical protein